MSRWADTGLLPPAIGVIDNALASPKGFRILRIVLGTIVCMKKRPTIWLVPVARPTTVVAFWPAFRTAHNWPLSVMLT